MVKISTSRFITVDDHDPNGKCIYWSFDLLNLTIFCAPLSFPMTLSFVLRFYNNRFYSWALEVMP